MGSSFVHRQCRVFELSMGADAQVEANGEMKSKDEDLVVAESRSVRAEPAMVPGYTRYTFCG